MEKVFSQEQLANNPQNWIFFIEGYAENVDDFAPYFEIEYAVREAQRLRIPVIDIVPGYRDEAVFTALLDHFGVEKTVFWLLLFGAQTGEIHNGETLLDFFSFYYYFCKDRDINFNLSDFQNLGFSFTANSSGLVADFKTFINTGNTVYDSYKAEFWDAHLAIRNNLARKNLPEVLTQNPTAKNILAYCGKYHKEVFTKPVN
ncbi:hypothetical protein NO2_1468 [Candidatus Termititenax persephonae]|uniref:Uncharacterized protein n=1 Tax=Candidatus Termititenax persephonae TaxID=2218525 RepID=A0A388TIF5_9BACT|nr:hypothetical protein NO2_1468 [Candidatus Termititenax persephonae]